MAYVAFVTLLILIQYLFFVLQAGLARNQETTAAPATTGDEMYERKLRVQINTLEQLIITLPAIWICAHYFSPSIATALGGAFIVGRFLYSYLYIKNPKSRAPGFVIGFLANILLLGCGVYGVIDTLL